MSDAPSTSRIDPARGFGEPDTPASRQRSREKVRPRLTPQRPNDDEGFDASDETEIESHTLDTTV
jgi:hypothetical protein